jgi:hypothetical protein
VGIGGNYSPEVRSGTFIFFGNGDFEYQDDSGSIYQGAWDVYKEWMRGGCQVDENGNSSCDDRYVRRLKVAASDVNTGDVMAEFFDEIVFTGTNKFKAFVYAGSRTYIFHFKRN